MRVCPKCKRQFPDNTLFCPDDGKALVDRTGSGQAPQQGSAPKQDPNFGATNSPSAPSYSDPDDDDATLIDATIDDVNAARDQHAAQAQNSASGSSPDWGTQNPVSTSSSQPMRERKSVTPTRISAPPTMNPAEQSASSSAPQTPMDPSDLVGQSLFGEYTITKKLGEGGMGAVYLAQQDSIDQRIAVKVLHEDAAESDELIQRFHREARVVSMLTHPNIIRVFIFGRTQGGLLYLAMEYVEGQELRSILDGGLLDEMRIIKIMKQLCSGLSEAHDLGIIHRDLKPDNVLLTEFRGEEDFAKILDFGIAKLKQPDTPEAQKNLTQAGIVYGTPEYLSPEQAQALELDHRTDIYSLGCILYEFMTGRVPFQASTPVKLLTAHVFNEVTPPSQISPDRVTPTMEKIILRAMEKEPADRFTDALEMFEALVAREQEIVSQRGLGNRAGYVPGMELTGMYSAVDFAKEMNSPPPTADAAMRAQPQNAGSTAEVDSPIANRQPQANLTQQSSDNSSTRMVIYLLIGGMGLLFVVLAITVVFLIAAG